MRSWILDPCLCPSKVLGEFRESTNMHRQNLLHLIILHSQFLAMVLRNQERKNGVTILHQLNRLLLKSQSLEKYLV